MKRVFMVILLPALLAVASAEEQGQAESIPDVSTQESPSPVKKPDVSEEEFSLFRPLDSTRDYFAEKIVSYSKSIDHFFGDERYFQEHNKSVVQLDLSETFNEGGQRNFLFEGKAKIDLPAAQRRFQLVLESNPEQKAASEIKKDQPAVNKSSAPPDQYAASVRYEKAEEDRWHYSADTGAQFQFPLDPFIRTRVSYSRPVADWRLKLAETVFWFSTIGLGETTQFDMEHVLTERALFRATSTVTCMEMPQICDLRQDLSVFHTLNQRNALVYQFSIIGNNKPTVHETNYILLTRYRHRLHKDWVYFEVTPQLFFPETDAFKMHASLLFKLEMLVGSTK